MKKHSLASFVIVFLVALPISVNYKRQNQDYKGEVRHNFMKKDRENLLTMENIEREILATSTDDSRVIRKGSEQLGSQIEVFSNVSGKKAVITCRQSLRFPDVTMVRITVPTIPDFQCDVWCYEDELGIGECFPQPDGTMILKHHHPKGAMVKTKIVPQEGIVDWYVTITGSTQEVVQSVEWVNPCWQFRHAPGFQSLPDQFVESYVNQCFIYTDRGFTFFKDTKRYPDTRKPDDDYRNTPPWVQSYYPVWREHSGQLEAGWGISDDRPIYSIIGIVSRDMKYLAAWGGKKSNRLSQGWHDCLHLRPLMIDYDEKTNRTVSHFRMYFMEFDSVKLIEQYKRDFSPPENPERVD